MPARPERTVPALHSTSVEASAIVSQNTNSVMRSPAKAAPIAPPA